ncbi:hypothetical protein EDB89DRAFT_1964914, partial [Lactarius sanguifluus]
MPATPTTTQWTLSDEKLLVGFLHEHRAASGDGGNFKMATFQAAAAIVEAKRTIGGPKTMKACQNKWAALRRMFRAVQAIINHTGWNWCDEKGANIQPDQAGAWSSFCNTHKAAKPFRNSGWVHLEGVSGIMPATVRGANVFCPSQGLMGLDQGYGREDTPEASQEELATQADEFENRTPVETSDDMALALQPVPVTPARHVWGAASTSSSCKRERALSQTPPPSSKKIKATGADAIKGLTQSISRFGDNICQVLAMDPILRTPHRRKEALKLAQQEEWLSRGDLLIFYSVLEKDINAVDAYVSIDRDDHEFCEMWVRDKVDIERTRRL